MDNRQKEIDNLKDYKYGFTTDIENTRAPVSYTHLTLPTNPEV